jgi:hypothetical protein
MLAALAVPLHLASAWAAEGSVYFVRIERSRSRGTLRETAVWWSLFVFDAC